MKKFIFKQYLCTYNFYHLLKAKANLCTSEMNVLVSFHTDNQILAEHLMLQGMELLQHFSEFTNIFMNMLRTLLHINT